MYCERCGTRTEETEFADWARGICISCADDELVSRIEAEKDNREGEELMFDTDAEHEGSYGLHFLDNSFGDIEVLDCHSSFLGHVLADEMGKFYFSCPSESSSKLSTWNLLGIAGYLQECNDVRL